MATPSSSGNHTLAARVGGHAGVLTSDDESLIIKPALAPELAFYQHVATAPAFAPLRNWIPAFMGTLKLHGKQEGTNKEGAPIIAPVAPEAEGVDKDHVVLENLTHGFTRPNVLDVKLGTVLYDEDASPEKRQRMEKAAKDTTSFETGIRLTGFQVRANQDFLAYHA
jgi:1D-myo-inositol-tetrakisphosphate 5-kinase/inositol-polyphosphate multikinase